MKNKKAIGVAVASALALALCGGALVGCGGDDPKPQKLTDKELSATKIADFETGDVADRKAVFATDGFENGDVFNTWWNSENVDYDNGVASLSISEMTTKEQKWNEEYDAEEAESNPDYDVPQYIDCQANYYGGEMRSSEYYGYGDYEVRMKPSNVKGTASTFFVCTGPYDVNYETKVPNKHDEVDIEFLGKDTTKVQFNYFVDGVGGHEYMYNLGFDASKEFHTYGFRWTSEYIVWFVDGKPVYKVMGSKSKPMPSTPGRILTNYWTGTEAAENWMGKLPADYSTKAQYKYIATSAEAHPDPTKAPETPPEELEVPETGWTDIDYSGFGGWSSDTYTVDKSDGLNISHTAKPGSYACEGMALSSNYSWVKFKVTNNSEENDAVVRVDIKKEGGAAGIVGVASEHEGVSFLSGDGAAMIELAAGESCDVACKISDKVTVNQFVAFLNSTAGATATAGDITISELKGIEAEAGNEPEPETPKVLIGTSEVAFAGNGYTIEASDDQKEMTVSYEDISGKGYNNISTSITDIVGDNNTFNFKLVNNGNATAKVRIDIKCKPGAVYTNKNDGSGCDYCNLEATLNGLAEGDLVANGNDYLYGGGDWIQIKAGGTVTGKILFKTGADVNPNMIALYFDSSTWDDETTHTGSVTVSDMSFSKEVVENVDPTLPEGEGWTAIDLTAIGAYVPDEGNTNAYTHEVSANSVHITHSVKPVAGSNLNVSPAYDTNNLVHMKIKNNLDSVAKIAINVQNPGWDYRTVIKGATINGTAIEVPAIGNNWDGFAIEVAANAEIILEVYLDTGASNLCIGLNNMADGAETGDILVSEISMNVHEGDVPTPPPAELEPVEGATLPEGEGWTAIDLSTIANSENNIYTITPGTAEDNSLNSVTISHEDARCAQYGNVNLNVNYGGNNKVYMVIKNNAEDAATVKISVQNPSDGYRNTMSSATATRESGTDSIGDLEWGAVFTLAANEEIVFECIMNPAISQALAIVLNENATDPMSGSITVSKVAIKTEAGDAE